jgi:hypothetical protein
MKNDRTSKAGSAHQRAIDRRNLLAGTTSLVAAAALTSSALAQGEKAAPAAAPAASSGKPNILVIFGDDIGQTNVSAYSFGVMGYKTPNIDRIAKEGMMFTDYYAENSCTAGRSSFITGQTPKRTGLSKVGIPGATVGLQDRDITIAQALKPLGYATGLFGKNHLGDRDEYLPTAHGFDEFFGNLYHLNAEEEPEQPSFPKDDPLIQKGYNPRGVIKSAADGKVEDSGPLTKKRMETIDDETSDACVDFIQRQVKANKPFFVWMNFTRMHIFTHVRASMRGQSGMPDNEYADGMIEHDNDVGKLLKLLDDLKIADNTIVVYTTDNGPNRWSWPDAATSPFRNEKDSNYEGAFRVPAMVQSALLEAMEERQVTVAGKTYKMPELFMVLATENPIEQEGTYPLPEAQLDRFLMHIVITYPDEAVEGEIIRLNRAENAARPKDHAAELAPVPQQAIFDARAEIDNIFVSDLAQKYMVDLIYATRFPGRYGEALAKWIPIVASPRGSLALDRCARARAWLDAQEFVTPDHVRAVVHDCLRHRLILSYEAVSQGVSADQVIDKITELVAAA